MICALRKILKKPVLEIMDQGTISSLHMKKCTLGEAEDILQEHKIEKIAHHRQRTQADRADHL